MNADTEIQEAIKTLLQGASFTGIPSANVRIRELPTANSDPIETLPAIFICPCGSYAPVAMGFDGPYEVPHGVEVCLIDKTQGQYGVNQQKRQEWQDLAERTVLRDSNGDFRRLAVSNFYNIDAVPSAVFDRSKFSSLYSYSSILFKVTTLG